MTHKWISMLIIAMTLAAGAARAEDEAFCIQAEQELKGRMFTAKLPLYEVRIWPDGIHDELERDAEEIRQGAKTIVKKIGCGNAKRIKMILEPDGPGEAVDIFFFISEADRQGPEARKTFDHMMTYVFEEAPGAED